MREVASLFGILSLVHGVILGAVLIYKSPKRKPLLLLGIFLLVYGLSFTSNIMGDLAVAYESTVFYLLPLRFYFLTYPILYLYVKYIMAKESFKEYSVHLYPGIAEFVILTGLFLFLPVEAHKSLLFSKYFIGYILLANAFSMYYLLRIKNLLKKHMVRVEAYYSSVENKLLDWLRMIIYVLLIIIINDTLFIIIQQGLKPDMDFLYGALEIIYVVQSAINMLVTYWIAFYGMRQYTISMESVDLDTFIEEVKLPIRSESNETKEFDEIYEQLVSFIYESKDFTNEELTIVDLANAMNMHYRKLSKIINQVAECNFNHFINRFRVEEAKRIMKDTDRMASQTLEVLGQEVGFKSPSSFYNAFKKFEGQTPAKYMKNIK